MSYGRHIKPCNEFRQWVGQSIGLCGKCAWFEKDHGTDASDEDKQINIQQLKDEESRKYNRIYNNYKHRNPMTHLIPKKKKRK